MKVIAQKIHEYNVKSLALNELSKDFKYEKGHKIKQDQDEAYRKYIFFKNLNIAVEKSKRDVR